GAFGIMLGPADERRRQALRMLRIVPAIAAFHAQPTVAAGPFASFRKHDLVLPHEISGCAADAAIRANTLRPLHFRARHKRQRERLVYERSRGTRGRAFAARHARAFTHRQIEVETDARREALAGAADHVVALDFIASADAAIAQDTGLVIDGDDRGRKI